MDGWDGLATRRAVVNGTVGLGFTALTGCLAGTTPDYQLRVQNGTQRSVSVSLTLTYLDEDRVVLNELLTLESVGSREYTDIITELGEYQMEIVVDENRHRTAEWEIPEDPGRFHRIIDITDDHIGVLSSSG